MINKTVLIVEDSEDTREVYTTFLRHHGYRVVEACTGLDGIQLARSERPDVIVMNLAMPHVDGLSATQALKADPATRPIPIIACSAFLRAQGELPAEEAGAETYLEKPCDPSRILEEVRRFAGEPLRAKAPAEGTR
jgi:two-component system, cell cycle response regulator DivK